MWVVGALSCASLFQTRLFPFLGSDEVQVPTYPFGISGATI